MKRHYRKHYGESLRNRVLNYYHCNAKRKGLIFTLSKEEFFALLDTKCFYCGCLPSHTVQKPHFYGTFTYNGVDRIDNTKGYILGNCVPCCKQCNYKKGSQHIGDFLAWIEKVYKFSLELDEEI